MGVLSVILLVWEDELNPRPRVDLHSAGSTQPAAQPLGDANMNPSRPSQAQRASMAKASPPVSPSKRERATSPASVSSPPPKRMANRDVRPPRSENPSQKSLRSPLTQDQRRSRFNLIAAALPQTGSQDTDMIPSQDSAPASITSTQAEIRRHLFDEQEEIQAFEALQEQEQIQSSDEVEEIIAMSQGVQADLPEDDEENRFWSSPQAPRTNRSPIESHSPGPAGPSRLPAAISEDSSDSAQRVPIIWRPTTPQRAKTHAHDGNDGADTTMLLTPPNSSQTDHTHFAYSISPYRNPDEVLKTPSRSKGKERELPATTSVSTQWQRTQSDPVNPFRERAPTLIEQDSMSGASVPTTPSTSASISADSMEMTLGELCRTAPAYARKLERKCSSSQQSLRMRDERIRTLQEENTNLRNKVRYLEGVVESLRAIRRAPS